MATFDLGTGDLLLSGADRSVERTGTVDDTTDVSTTGDGLNDNDFNQIVITANAIEIDDVSELVVNRIFSNGDATLESAGNMILNGPVSLGTGDLLVNSGADIVAGNVQAENVSFNAQDDVRDTRYRDGQFVDANTLTIVALDEIDDGGSDGVRLDTAAEELSVTTQNGGGVFINELDDITLTSISSNGRLIVDAGGSIRSVLVSVASSDGNDVRLSSPEQIVVSRLLAPRSNLFLVAGDDVVSADSGRPIIADQLTVRASNNRTDGQDGIVLSTNVASLDLFISDVASPNTGVISIAEENAVVATAVVNRVGAISISTNGNLVARRVFSRGSVVDDAIRLTASGIGADVITGRVATFQRLGGIAITAGDDIRSTAGRPGIDNLLQSGHLELTAGNNEQGLQFNGILAAQTRVRSLTANVTSAGEAEIFVVNDLFLNVQDLSVLAGSISLSNTNGKVTVQNASIQNATSTGSISLTTEGDDADLIVGNIFARGSIGVFLNSADDIFDPSIRDEIFIDTDFLSATSNNNVENERGNGIFLSSNAERVSTSTPNGGSVFIVDKA